VDGGEGKAATFIREVARVKKGKLAYRAGGLGRKDDKRTYERGSNEPIYSKMHFQQNMVPNKDPTCEGTCTLWNDGLF